MSIFSLVRRREPEAAQPPPPPAQPAAPVAEMPRVPHWQNYTREYLMNLRATDEQTRFLHNLPPHVLGLFGQGIPPCPGTGKMRLAPGTYRVRASDGVIRIYDARNEDLGINSSGCFLVSDHRVIRTKYDNDGLAEVTIKHGKGTYMISHTGGGE